MEFYCSTSTLTTFFYFTEEGTLANFADDNTPHSVGEDIDSVLNNLSNDANTLIKWFEDNYFVMNPDKCKLLVTNSGESVSLEVSGHIVEASDYVKLLGIKIERKLDFEEHVSYIYKKASQKLHALARISNLMSKEKLRMLMKAFIESQFGYCPLIWMYHGRILNNKINRLHERALRLVYKTDEATFEELLTMDCTFNVHHRNLQKLAIEMYKVKNELSPNFIQQIFQPMHSHYNLRSESDFRLSNIKTVHYGSDTISYMGPKIWNMIPSYIKNSANLLEFKTKIKLWLPKGCECRICKVYIYRIGFI